MQADRSGFPRLLADLQSPSIPFLRLLFDREQSPNTTLNDAALFTVLNEIGTEYGIDLDPMIKELTEIQKAENGSKRLDVTFEKLQELLHQHAESRLKALKPDVKKAKSSRKPSEVPKSDVSDPPPIPETKPDPAIPIPPSPFMPASKPTHEVILETRLRQKNLLEWHNSPRVSKPKRSKNRSPKPISLSKEDITVPEPTPEIPKTAEYVLSTWTERLTDIKTLYSAEGPIRTLESLANQSQLTFSDQLATVLQEKMTEKTAKIEGETADMFEAVFWPAVSEWLLVHPGLQTKEAENPSELLISKLKSTISDIESIEKAQFAAGLDTSQSKQLLETLKKQLVTVGSGKGGGKVGNAEFLNACKEGIHEVYVFYAKQTKMIGMKPSFDEILHSTTILTMGKFLKFLRDFQLLESSKLPSHKVIDRSVLPTQTAASIFKRTAQLQKEMDEDQFTLALDLLSMAYFDSKFDEITGADTVKLPLAEKRERMYRTLGLDSEQTYREKMKGYGVPFSTYTDYRIPENDPARKYKYKEYKHQRMPVAEWRSQVHAKPQVSRSTESHSSLKPTPKAKPQAKKPKKTPFDALFDLDSSDIDLDALISPDQDSSQSDIGSPMGYKQKSTPALLQFAGLKGKKGEKMRAEELMRTSQNRESEAITRAMRAANAQLEKGRKVAMRMEEATNRYKE